MRRHATPTRLILAGFMLLQLAWILVVPPFGAIDEFDHAYRAAGVAGGDVVADQVPTDGRGLLVAVPPDLVEAAHDQCADLEYTGPDNCSAAGTAPEGRVLVASGAASYHPAFYWAVGTISAPWSGTGRLLAMRVATALICAVFIGLAAWSATRTPGAWPVVGLGVALTPVLVYSTAIVAPNGVEMSAALALWTSLLRLRVEPDHRTGRRLLLVAICAATVMATLRLLGPLWVLLAVATVAAFDPAGTWSAVRRHGRLVIVGAALVSLSTLNFLGWQLGPAGAASNPDPVTERDSVTIVNVVVWALQGVAAFPFRNQPGPLVVYVVAFAAIGGLLVLAFRSVRGRQRAVLMVAVAAVVLIPVVATLSTIETRGLTWQGRYGLPFSAGVLILASSIVAERPTALRLPSISLLVGGAAYVVAVAACLLKVRRLEIDDGAAVMSDGAWWVPSPVLLLVIVTLGIAALSTPALMRTRELSGSSGSHG